MKNALLLCCVLATLASADEPRIRRVSEQEKAAARAALEASLTYGTLRDGGMFAGVVTCGPRLWAAIEKRHRNEGDAVGTATLLFDGAERAEAWGFRQVSLTEGDPKKRQVLKTMLQESPGRVPIEIGVFRSRYEKLGMEVARMLASPARPAVRETAKPEVLYLWMMVPYDLEEPLFVIQAGATRFLVNLDEDHRIYWIDSLPADV